MTEHERLERLVRRARKDMREWADSPEEDPGVALVDLLAYVGDLLSAYQDRVADESGLGSSGNRNRFAGVRLQEGRVVIDADWNQPDGDLCGIYRAVVTDAADPLLMRRVRVLVPEVPGEDSLWAMACLTLGASDETPSVGDAVWVAFESGDPDRPVWIGRLYSAT